MTRVTGKSNFTSKNVKGQGQRKWRFI